MKTQNQKGQIIIFAAILAALLLVASASLVGYTTLNVKGARMSYASQQALYLAQAGINKAVHELNTGGVYNGETGTSLGAGGFNVSVSSLSGSSKRITSTGYVTNGGAQASQTVQATVDINSASIAFNTGVQVGGGGLVMDNNSIINGNVFSNGNITGSNGASITSDVIVAQGSASSANDEWTVQNNDFNFGNIAARKDVAESYKISGTDYLTKIQAYIKKVGNPGDITVRIMADNSGSPGKTVVATASLLASTVTDSYGWDEATFASPPNLSDGVTYWLMLSAAGINAGNYYYWGTDNNNGFGNGFCAYSANYNAASPVWNNAGADCDFKVFMGGAATYIDGTLNIGGNATSTEIRGCNAITKSAYYVSVFNNCTASNAYASSTIPGPAAMPVSDSQITDWENTAVGGGVISGSHTITATETMGPEEINGDLTMNNGTTLILTGPVWVKGNITMSNGTTIKIDPSLGNAGTVILADNPADPMNSGIINISNNTIIVGNGNPNSYPLVLTTSSNLTGAMYIFNNSAGAVYYASEGSIEVSNNAGGNQITGYKIHLNNNSTVNYQSGLANATFSNGPGGSWEITAGSYVVMP